MSSLTTLPRLFPDSSMPPPPSLHSPTSPLVGELARVAILHGVILGRAIHGVRMLSGFVKANVLLALDARVAARLRVHGPRVFGLVLDFRRVVPGRGPGSVGYRVELRRQGGAVDRAVTVRDLSVQGAVAVTVVIIGRSRPLANVYRGWPRTLGVVEVVVVWVGDGGHIVHGHFLLAAVALGDVVDGRHTPRVGDVTTFTGTRIRRSGTHT